MASVIALHRKFLVGNALLAARHHNLSPRMREEMFDKLLQQHLDAQIQVVEHVAGNEAALSGLLSYLRTEIVSFLDFFLESHSWKRLFVESRIGILDFDFKSCTHDERRAKTMEFAGQMSKLVQSTFPEGTEDYVSAMSGLGRIVELLLIWQSEGTTSNVPKYRGSKIDGDAIAFLHAHYARLIASGRLTQISLRRMDEKLLNSLKYELRKSGRAVGDLVPPGIARQ